MDMALEVGRPSEPKAEVLKGLLDAISDHAICLLDPEGRVTRWNASAERSQGFSESDLLGQHYSMFFPQEDVLAGRPDAQLDQASVNGRFEGEGWRLRKDGSVYWARIVITPMRDDAGYLAGYARVTHDLTEQMKAEQAARRSEELFRRLVEGIKDYAIYMLSPAGILQNWNSGAEAIKGYSAEDIIGRHYSIFHTDEDREKGEPDRALKVAAASGRFEAEAWRVRKDGSLFWASVIIDPIRGPDGTLIGFAKITRDMSDRLRADAQLKEAREALAQDDKMKALGRLTGGVAHDFNNLLQVINASVEILRRGATSPDKLDRHLSAIGESAEQATRITAQLLAFSRKQSLNAEQMVVEHKMHEMLPMLRSVFGTTKTLIATIATEGALIDVDSAQLGAALLNIATNARDAMKPGGCAVFDVKLVPFLPAIRGHEAVMQPHVSFALHDDGDGMSADVVGHAFEPFFTTKAFFKGTGLGLSQVYGFVRQSGGNVSIVSAPGRGTTVTIYLPVRGQAAGAVREAKQASIAASVDATRIMLVEDNLLVGESTAQALTEYGHDVEWVKSGEAALAAIAEAEHGFEVMISDVIMPGISGFQLARMVAQRWPDMRILLASGYSNDLVQTEANDISFLMKPYMIRDLTSWIANALPHKGAA